MKKTAALLAALLPGGSGMSVSAEQPAAGAGAAQEIVRAGSIPPGSPKTFTGRVRHDAVFKVTADAPYSVFYERSSRGRGLSGIPIPPVRG